jgi:RNA polymerase sigma-70 factor (ECF subfamily)
MLSEDPVLDASLRPHAERLAAQREFVRGLACRLVAPDAADDLAQDVLTAALHRPPRQPSALQGWLAAVTRHLASKLRRGEARRVRREQSVARPEALPSTRELVERIELEQELVRAVLHLPDPDRTTVLLRFHEGLAPAEIAARIGVPADTVRARVRRGLERIRLQLDQKYGARSWVGWLLPIGGAGAPATSTVAAGVMAAGATLMAAKIWIAGAAATVAMVAGIGHGSRWLPPLLGGAPRPELALRGEGGAWSAIAAADDAKAALPPVAERQEDASDVDPDAATAAPLPPPGEVRLRVVDRATGAVIEEGVRARFLADKRFAEREGGGEVDVRLSGGRWTGRIHARGFEPYDLGAFTVDAAVPLDLGTIELEGGSAVIEGEVLARHLAADQPVRVELRGDGMGRCVACRNPAEEAAADEASAESPPPAEPTHACGRGDDPSWHLLGAARRFRFEGLAQGVYQLRAFDPQHQIVDAARIEVHRGGYLWVPLEVSAPTTTLLELRHARGGRFHGDWAAIHAETTSPLEFTVERDGTPIARGSWQPSAEEVRETQGDPLVPLPAGEAATDETWLSPPRVTLVREVAPTRLGAWNALTDADQARVTLEDVTLYMLASRDFDRSFEGIPLAHQDAGERDREPADTLDWAQAPAAPEPAALAVQKIRPDAFRLSPLPRALLTVRVRSGGYESDPFPLDLRFGEGLPAVVALPPTPKRLEEIAWSRLPPPASCVTCHGQRSVNEQEMWGDLRQNAIGDVVRRWDPTTNSDLIEFVDSPDDASPQQGTCDD